VFLQTDRLKLREFTPDDLDDLAALDSDPEVMKFLTGGKPIPREEVERVLLPRYYASYELWPAFGTWAADDADGFVGWFALQPMQEAPQDLRVVELGYRIARDRWGRGYATEGSIALIRKGFTELGVEQVRAQTMTVNKGSRRVMEKSGLVYERTFFFDFGGDPIEGGDQGDVWYAADRDDWLKRFGTD
jgi:RimJ/RimL family protein N-acetyltransferase